MAHIKPYRSEVYQHYRNYTVDYLTWEESQLYALLRAHGYIHSVAREIVSAYGHRFGNTLADFPPPPSPSFEQSADSVGDAGAQPTGSASAGVAASDRTGKDHIEYRNGYRDGLRKSFACLYGLLTSEYR